MLSLSGPMALLFSQLLIDLLTRSAVNTCARNGAVIVSRYRLDRKVSSLLIGGGGRLFSTLLTVMLYIAVLTNEV